MDSVHTDTYRVLGGLNRGDGKDGLCDDDEDNSGDEGREAGAGAADDDVERLRKKRAGAAAKKVGVDTLENNPDNLNVKKFDLGFDVDPLFHKTSASFDEGGASGLLLNTLSAYRGCSLIFDSNNYTLDAAVTSAPALSAAAAAARLATIDVTDLRESILEGGFFGAELWPAFGEFISYLEDQVANLGPLDEKRAQQLLAQQQVAKKSEDKGRVSDASDRASLSSAGAPVASQPEMMGGLAAPEYDDDYNYGGGVDDDDSGDFGGIGNWGDDSDYQERKLQSEISAAASAATAAFSSPEVEAVLGRWSSDAPAAAKNFDISQVVMGLADSANEYCYFDPRLLQNWAGPSHWKRFAPAASSAAGAGNALTEEGQAHDDDSAAAAGKGGRRPKRAEIVIDFTAEDKTDYREAFAVKKRAVTTLAQVVLDKLSEEDNTLPAVDHHVSVSSLVKLFLRPSRLVQLAGKVSSAVAIQLRQGNSNQALTGAGADFAYNYNNAHDLENFVPFGPGASSSRDDDDDDGGGGVGVDDYSDGEQHVMPGAQGSESSDSQRQQSQPQLYENLGLDLLSAPRKVEKLTISYSKIAKKMDVKVLKESIWADLTGRTTGRTLKPKTTPEVPVERTFTEVIQSLPKTMPVDILPNVSVSYVFICLLHLANEKGLSLSNNQALSELHIIPASGGAGAANN